jgi:hypothetical protein
MNLGYRKRRRSARKMDENIFNTNNSKNVQNLEKKQSTRYRKPLGHQTDKTKKKLSMSYYC